MTLKYDFSYIDCRTDACTTPGGFSLPVATSAAQFLTSAGFGKYINKINLFHLSKWQKSFDT